MNFFTFLITRTLVENKTGDSNRANQLALATSFVPGTYGLMMGMLLANNEPAPKPPSDGVGKPPTATATRALDHRTHT